MADEQNPEQPVDVGAITEQVLAKVAEHLTLDAFTDFGANVLLKAITGLAKGLARTAAPIAQLGGTALVALEEPVLPIFAAFVAPIVANLFGTQVDAHAFESRGSREERGGAARAIVDAYMTALAGDAGGELAPSDEGAKRIAGAAAHATLEGWFNELIPEIIGEMIPIDWMHFEAFAGLSEEMISALGIGRLVRRAFSPLVDVVAATPMKWKVHKQYRPTLLSPAQAIRQAYRGNWDWADVQEICEREGYSDAAIAALINEQRKFQSVGDVRQLVTRGEWTSDRGLQHLRDQGYDEDSAALALRLEGLRRIEQHEASIAGPLLAAFVARDIDDATFARIRDTAIGPPAERALLTELGQIRRELNIKRLTASDVKAAVRAGILAMVDYRGWLEREGYNDDDALTLELLLRAEIDADFQADKAREQAQAERAAAKAARDEAAQQRLAAVEAERARRARGSIADLQRAVVRGLIPIARLEEVLRVDYDADTVAILVGLAEDDRQRYLEQQQRADDARQAAARRAIDVGALEAAVLEQVITVDSFRARLEALHFPPADVDVLAATVAAKLADQIAAVQKRKDAAVSADRKQIDLARFEQLVRRGVRTLAEYDALLQQLGYDDASRAALDELLQLHIADDRAAEEARRRAREADAHKGVTLEQLRRAVILGLQPAGAYEAFLVQNGFTAEAVAVLMGELADDVAQADAARRRRDAADAARARPALPLATLARAARLGIVPVTTYQQRLTDDGYAPDDIAIEMDLLTTEMADVQAARARQAAADAAPATAGVTLAQLERGVRAGTATLEDYRARAVATGLAAADVDTLTRIIGDEALTSQAARARRAEIGSTLDPKTLAIGPLEDQVRAGALTIDQYRATLIGAGVAVDDAALLAGLLAASLGEG